MCISKLSNLGAYNMPVMPSGGRISRQVFGQSWIDSRGRTRSTSIRLGSAVILNAAAVDTYSATKAKLSNAGLYETRNSAEVAVIKTAAQAYDEAESSADTVLVTVWQDANGRRIEDVIPAPDRSILTPDGLSLIDGDAAAAADTPEKIAADYRVNIKAMLDGTYGIAWTFARSYVSSYKGRGARGGVEQPTVIEPTAGNTPPPDPAT